MTTQKDILNDERYIPLFDHGFVGLIDAMPSGKGEGDKAIVQAARVSYGDGTKSIRDDRNLIRYLMRHEHTSPFEMVEFKFHMKIPIFVMRQLVRHRTANLNEYSGRYSIMSSEFYIPEKNVISYQKKTNKQGREDFPVHETDATSIQELMHSVYTYSYNVYSTLIGEQTDVKLFQDKELNERGIARELARIVLPVANYTELYFKQDLKNLLHFLKLRMSEHAQYEIRVLANAMYRLIKDHVPLTTEAWEDYVVHSVRFSRQEMAILKEFLGDKEEDLYKRIEENEFLSKGEKREFVDKIRKLLI